MGGPVSPERRTRTDFTTTYRAVFGPFTWPTAFSAPDPPRPPARLRLNEYCAFGPNCSRRSNGARPGSKKLKAGPAAACSTMFRPLVRTRSLRTVELLLSRISAMSVSPNSTALRGMTSSTTNTPSGDLFLSSA